MTPLLHDGDYLVVRKTLPIGGVQIGNVVTVKHPHLGPIIKTIVAVTNENVRLEGISKLSTSTSALGVVNREHIDGVGIAVIPTRSKFHNKRVWFRRLKAGDIQTLMARK